ncbi:MAG: hypothetical protein CMH57_12080 [Myxococcales bacterium]|nr:hypothetical protein [Myxococcales bacterium]
MTNPFDVGSLLRELTVCGWGGDATSLLKLVMLKSRTNFHVYDLDDGRLIYTNRAVGGWSPEEIAARSGSILDDLIHPDDADALKALLGRLAELGPDDRAAISLRCRVKGGGWTEVLNQYGVLMPRAGRSPLILGYSIELRDLELVQNRMYRNIIDQAVVPMFLFALSGRVRYANQAALSSLGYTLEQLQGLHLWDIDPMSSATFLHEVAPRLVAGEPLSFESAMRTSDGRMFPVHVTASCVEYDGEQFIWGQARDLTLEKQAEADRLLMERQIQNNWRLEALGQLAGWMAHDFNNLMTIVQSSTTLARAAGSDSDALKIELDAIEDASERAAALTGRLLSLSRRHEPPDPSPLNVSAAIQSFSGMLERLLPTDIALQMDIDESPDVSLDLTLLQQVLLNLTFHARQVMSNGGGALKVATGAASFNAPHATAHETIPAGRYATLSVSCTGEPLTEEIVPGVYEPFSEARDMVRHEHLELATLYGLIKRGGGFLTIEPSRNLFSIFYPARRHSPPAPKRQRRSSWADLEGRVVLLVEDEPLLRRILKRTLDRAGCVVYAVGDGLEALKTSGRVHIDALITDVVLPGMDGFALVESIRDSHPALPVLIISGYTRGVALSLPERCTFLQKPFKPSTLLEQLTELLKEP